jgi:predicted nucleic acid-binding protein
MSSKIPVIADTSALLTFASIGRLDLLEGIFGQISIPLAVWREIYVKDLMPNQMLFNAFRFGSVFRRVDLPVTLELRAKRYALTVDWGEAETIALGHHMNQSVLIDDLAARKLAVRERVQVIGSLGVLAACKKKGLISRVRPLTEAMVEAGRFLGPAVLRTFHQRMEET